MKRNKLADYNSYLSVIFRTTFILSSVQKIVQMLTPMFCLFNLILYVPVNTFSVMSGWISSG